jgi:predicted DNA-binding protein (MmcQ/YjbR family)
MHMPKKTARPTQDLRDFCRALPFTTEDIKWGDNQIFSVGGRMYAGFELENPQQFAFKCDDVDFERLTAIEGIIPAPYAARHRWVKVTRRGLLPGVQCRHFLRKSYDLVFAKLPARVRKQLADQA